MGNTSSQIVDGTQPVHLETEDEKAHSVRSSSDCESLPTERMSKKRVHRSNSGAEEDNHPKRKKVKTSSESSKPVARGRSRDLSALVPDVQQAAIKGVGGAEAVDSKKHTNKRKCKKRKSANESAPVSEEGEHGKENVTIGMVQEEDCGQDAAFASQPTTTTKKSKKRRTADEKTLKMANVMGQTLKDNGDVDAVEGDKLARTAAKKGIRQKSKADIEEDGAAAIQEENEITSDGLSLQIDEQEEQNESHINNMHQGDDEDGVDEDKPVPLKRHLSKRKSFNNATVSAAQSTEDEGAIRAFQQKSTPERCKKSNRTEVDNMQEVPEKQLAPEVEDDEFSALVHADGKRTVTVRVTEPQRNKKRKQKHMKLKPEMIQNQADAEATETPLNSLDDDDDLGMRKAIITGTSPSGPKKRPSVNAKADSSRLEQLTPKIDEADGEEDGIQEPTPPESPQQEKTATWINELPFPGDTLQSPRTHAPPANSGNDDGENVVTAPIKPSVRRATNIPNIGRSTRVDLPAPLTDGPAAGPYTEAEKAAADDVFDYVFQTEPKFIEPCQLQALIVDWSNADVFREEIIAVFPNRTLASIRKFCQRRYTLWDKNVAWTAAEDEELRRAYRETPGNWVRIADSLDRRPMDCESRWKNHVQYGGALVTGPWSAEEEARLVLAVQDCIEQMKRSGAKSDDDMLESSVSWMMVSEKLDRKRSAKRCREKWKMLKQRSGGVKAVIASATEQPSSSLTNNATSAKEEKKYTKDELTALRKLDCFQPGDYFDVLTEIHTALPDPTAVFHHSETTLWSIVAQKNPDSRFTSVLRRMAFKAALDHYGTKVGGVKNVIGRDGTVAEQAKAMCGSLSRWAKKEGLTVKEFGRGYDVPSVKERREAQRKKKLAKQKIEEGEMEKERRASTREQAGAEEERPTEDSDGEGGDDGANGSSTISSSSSTPISRTPPTPTPAMLDGQVLNRWRPPGEVWPLSSVRDNDRIASDPLYQEAVVPETQQSQQQQPEDAVALNDKANENMAAADDNDEFTVTSNNAHRMACDDDDDMEGKVDECAMANGYTRKADMPTNTNRLLWPGLKTAIRRERRGGKTFRFLDRTRGQR